MIQKTLYKLLRDIVLQETVFLRHYIGEVVNNIDTEKKGRVEVTLPDLSTVDGNGISQDFRVWCFPRDKNSMTVPKAKDWVEVYFVAGRNDMPVYMGTANEIQDMLPKNYESPFTQVIFEDPDDDKVKIVYNQTLKTLNVNSTKISFNDGSLKNF